MRSNGFWAGGAVLLLLFLCMLYPLLAVITNIFLPGLFFGEVHYTGFGLLLELFERPLWRQSLTNSLTLGLGTAFVGTLLGALLAILRSQWSFRASRLLDVSAWVLLIVPSFMIAQGWVLFAGSGGLANQWLGWTWLTELIFQPFGLILVMSLCKFPLAYLAVTAALEWNVSHYGDAARLNGGGPLTVWRTVHLPLSLPAITAGWTLVFMDTIGDFGLPAALATVYRFPTLPYSIYTAIYQSPVRFDMAGVLALYLVAILAVAMAILFFALRKSRVDFLTSRAVVQAPKPSRYSGLMSAVVLLVLVVAVGIPVGTSISTSLLKQLGGGLTWANLTLDHYISLFRVSPAEHRTLPLFMGMRNSFLIAGLAAIMSMALGFLTSYVVTFTRFRFKSLIHLSTVLSLAVPGVVLGIGYIFVWNQRWLEHVGLHLYGTPTLLVMAAVAGAIPYAVRLQIGAFAKIPASMLNAAAMQGAGTVRRMKDILLPLVRGGLLTATLASFGTSVYDLAIASILKPPNYTLVPLVIDKAFEFSQYGYAAAATVFSGTIVILLLLLGSWLGKRWLS